MKRLWGFGKKTSRRVIAEREVMAAEELLECFVVDEGSLLLKGVLHVVRASGEVARDAASNPESRNSVRTFDAGRMANAADLEEEILRLVADARRAS